MFDFWQSFWLVMFAFTLSGTYNGFSHDSNTRSYWTGWGWARTMLPERVLLLLAGGLVLGRYLVGTHVVLDVACLVAAAPLGTYLALIGVRPVLGNTFFWFKDRATRR